MSKQFFIKQFSLASISNNSVFHSTQFICKHSLIVKNISIWAIQFRQTVLIQTIQFSINMQLVVFNPYQVLPFRASVDLETMAMKVCSAFPKAPASLETHHQNV